MRIGTPRSLRFARDEFDLFGLAQVARVETKSVDTRLQRGERHLDVKVNVGHDRHRRARHNLSETLGGGLLVTGTAHDVGPVRRQGVDLLEGALDVGRLGRGHRLHRDRRVAAHFH